MKIAQQVFQDGTAQGVTILNPLLAKLYAMIRLCQDSSNVMTEILLMGMVVSQTVHMNKDGTAPYFLLLNVKKYTAMVWLSAQKLVTMEM